MEEVSKTGGEPKQRRDDVRTEKDSYTFNLQTSFLSCPTGKLFFAININLLI